MTERVVWRRCSRCGAPVVILTTDRARRIPVNPEPVGDTKANYRSVSRHETHYVYGEHQPHVITCTNPAPRRKTKTKRYIR